MQFPTFNVGTMFFRGPTPLKHVEIATSKRGQLWPSQYWKGLVDAIARRKGSKKDPRLLYPDLSEVVDKLIDFREARYFPKSDGPLANHDDAAVSVITVRRVSTGKETVRIGHSRLPKCILGLRFEFPYFGTIGHSKYELQTKLNRQRIIAEAPSILAAANQRRAICLSFCLSRSRRDRDLDNLADALFPAFNAQCPLVDQITLIKLPPANSTLEVLGFGADGFAAADVVSLA